MKDVLKLEPVTVISRDNSYIISYPHILACFQSHNIFSVQDFICCTHIIYGWMPTILSINPNNEIVDIIDFSHGAELLTKAKRNGYLSDMHIENLIKLVNNSLVGVSKLLHFIAPNFFAIWDSKIYKFIFENEPYNYKVNKIHNYRKYLSILEEIKNKPGFPTFHASVNKKLGYEVTPLRAIELIMFLNIP